VCEYRAFIICGDVYWLHAFCKLCRQGLLGSALSLSIAACLIAFTHSTFGQVPTGQPSATVAAPSTKPKDPEQCFQEKDPFSEVNNSKPPLGGALALDTPFLGTGSAIDIGLDVPYKDDTFYFAALVDSATTEKREIVDTRNITYRRSQDGDTLVKKRLLGKDRVILGMTIPDGVAGYWNRAELFVYNCAGSPVNVSRLEVRVSSWRWSTTLTWASIIVAYLIASFAFRSGPLATQTALSALNPVKMTAGPDGKASLGKLQILFFSLIVFGLIVFFLLRTGVLSDISSTVLLLLGISGVGSTIAKGADAQRTTISPDNRGWLLRKGWLSLNPLAQPNVAQWQDLFTTDGEFDVYRYQSFIFSLAVGVALIAGGVTQLSSFTIPDTLLGILGLSQAVYIGGKLVTPTTMADLNKAIVELRDLETKFRTAVSTARPGFTGTVGEAATIAASDYGRYAEKAKDVGILFRSLTGIDVRPEKLEPSMS
jgi:hypothetical protein